MRRSMSRIASRYSLSLERSRAPRPRLEAVDIARDVIENAALLLQRARRAAGSVLSPSPNRRSNTARGFGSIGSGVVGAAPGNRVGVRAAIAGVAAAGEARRVEADLERGELRALAELLGRDLVDRNAGVDVRAFGLLGVDAGEPGGARARVVARAVAERAAVDLRQAAQHDHAGRGTARAASWCA